MRWLETWELILSSPCLQCVFCLQGRCSPWLRRCRCRVGFNGRPHRKRERERERGWTRRERLRGENGYLRGGEKHGRREEIGMATMAWGARGLRLTPSWVRAVDAQRGWLRRTSSLGRGGSALSRGEGGPLGCLAGQNRGGARRAGWATCAVDDGRMMLLCGEKIG